MSDESFDTTPWRSPQKGPSGWQRLAVYLLALPVFVVVGARIGDTTYDCPADASDCDLGFVNILAGGVIGLVVGLFLIVVVEITLARRSRR